MSDGESMSIGSDRMYVLEGTVQLSAVSYLAEYLIASHFLKWEILLIIM